MKAAVADSPPGIVPSMPSAEDWARIEAELSHPFGRVDLRVDERWDCGLRVEPWKALQYRICVYIDGWFRGEWIVNDCAERRRFYRRIESPLWPRAKVADVVKRFGKKEAERLGMFKKSVHWSFSWPSARGLRRHLVKCGGSIRLLKVGP